jgi:hypothetical protein
MRSETIITRPTITDQKNKFFKNSLVFEFNPKNLGRIKIKTSIKKIAGTI